jgi:calcineurin-like phosphoesterase family protein
MTEWFTSDLHFGHKRIIELAGRPFADLDEMEEAFIQEWNDTVAPGDLIYHLGDLSFLNAVATAGIVNRLKGSIHFIRGNHDEALAKAFRGGLLGAVRPNSGHQQQRGAPRFLHDYKEVRIDGRKVVMFHFPISVWNGAHNGAWHLHGHSHGNFPHNDQPLMDVGYDATGRVLTSWDQVVDTLSTRSYTAADHHGGLD